MLNTNKTLEPEKFNFNVEVELERAIEKIKSEKSKTVLLQVPQGLKPKALKWADEISEKTPSQVFIWAGTCYGACDVPKVNVDLLVHVGHTPLKNSISSE